jgi:hypothetical protein
MRAAFEHELKCTSPDCLYILLRSTKFGCATLLSTLKPHDLPHKPVTHFHYFPCTPCVCGVNQIIITPTTVQVPSATWEITTSLGHGRNIFPTWTPRNSHFTLCSCVWPAKTASGLCSTQISRICAFYVHLYMYVTNYNTHTHILYIYTLKRMFLQ